jgi:hypothetical protein
LSAVITRVSKLAQADGNWNLDELRRALLMEAQRIRILEEIYDGEAAIIPGLNRTMPAAPRTKVGAGERKVA